MSIAIVNFDDPGRLIAARRSILKAAIICMIVALTPSMAASQQQGCMEGLQRFPSEEAHENQKSNEKIQAQSDERDRKMHALAENSAVCTFQYEQILTCSTKACAAQLGLQMDQVPPSWPMEDLIALNTCVENDVTGIFGKLEYTFLEQAIIRAKLSMEDGPDRNLRFLAGLSFLAAKLRKDAGVPIQKTRENAVECPQTPRLDALCLDFIADMNEFYRIDQELEASKSEYLNNFIAAALVHLRERQKECNEKRGQ